MQCAGDSRKLSQVANFGSVATGRRWTPGLGSPTKVRFGRMSKPARYKRALAQAFALRHFPLLGHEYFVKPRRIGERSFLSRAHSSGEVGSE